MPPSQFWQFHLFILFVSERNKRKMSQTIRTSIRYWNMLGELNIMSWPYTFRAIIQTCVCTVQSGNEMTLNRKNGIWTFLCEDLFCAVCVKVCASARNIVRSLFGAQTSWWNILQYKHVCNHYLSFISIIIMACELFQLQIIKSYHTIDNICFLLVSFFPRNSM